MAAPPGKAPQQPPQASAVQLLPTRPVDDEAPQQQPHQASAVELLPTLRVDCVELSYELRDPLPIPRLVIRTNGAQITEAAVNALIDVSQQVIDRNEEYVVLWDLRASCKPSSGPIFRCLRWAAANKSRLDAQLKCLTICLSSSLMRGVVDLVLRMARPPMPRLVCATPEEAWAFACGISPTSIS